MSGQRGSRRGELARLCAELRGRDCTYREIAGRIQREHRVNAQVVFRWAHGLTQAQVAERWNAQWPEQETPRTAKQISYWETWPAPSGRRPSLDTLNKLAFLYQCSAGDLLDGQDHSHLDPAAGSPAGPSERSGEPAPPAVAVAPAVVARGTADPPVVLPDPVEVVAAPRHQLVVAGRFATRLAALLGDLIVVADGTLGLSARQRDAACQQLVDLFTTEASTMNRRAVFQVLAAAAAAVAGPVFTGLDPDGQERLAAAIQAPDRVDAAVLDHLEQMLGHCVRQQNKGLGPQAVLDTVLAQRQLAAGMLAECPSALRSRLLSVYADQSRVSGWVSVDLKDFDGRPPTTSRRAPLPTRPRTRSSVPGCCVT